MTKKLLEHGAATLFVFVVLIMLLSWSQTASKNAEAQKLSTIKNYVSLPFANYASPFHQALFLDVLNIYYPGQADSNRAIAKQVKQYQEHSLGASLEKAHVRETLTLKKFWQLMGMYIPFLMVYAFVMILTYYGVETIGTWRFIARKNAALSSTPTALQPLTLFFKIASGLASFILFCPAYVIAYSLRTEIKTDTTFFMIILGVISNGLLIMYANKFYSFLVTEARKGYVETARAKNLVSTYDRKSIPLKNILDPRKNFEGHIVGHIFVNARSQYLASLKEQAAFLITGLIIIEMALNIHGHLSYELLKQMLYMNWDIVIAIILLIFLTVKATEVIVDFMLFKQNIRYGNHA